MTCSIPTRSSCKNVSCKNMSRKERCCSIFLIVTFSVGIASAVALASTDILYHHQGRINLLGVGLRVTGHVLQILPFAVLLWHLSKPCCKCDKFKKYVQYGVFILALISMFVLSAGVPALELTMDTDANQTQNDDDNLVFYVTTDNKEGLSLAVIGVRGGSKFFLLLSTWISCLFIAVKMLRLEDKWAKGEVAGNPGKWENLEERVNTKVGSLYHHYTELGDKIKPDFGLLKQWFFLHYFVYLLYVSAELVHVLDFKQKKTEPLISIIQSAALLGYDLLALLIPYYVATWLNQAHHKYHSKMVETCLSLVVKHGGSIFVIKPDLVAMGSDEDYDMDIIPMVHRNQNHYLNRMVHQNNHLHQMVRHLHRMVHRNNHFHQMVQWNGNQHLHRMVHHNRKVHRNQKSPLQPKLPPQPTSATTTPTQGPHNPTQGPHNPTQGPHNPTQGPHNPTQGPHNPTKGPHNPTKGPHNPTKGPHNPTKGPHNPTKGPHNPTKGPHNPTKGPHNPTKGPHNPLHNPTKGQQTSSSEGTPLLEGESQPQQGETTSTERDEVIKLPEDLQQMYMKYKVLVMNQNVVSAPKQEFDFIPSIFGVSIPLESPGYALAIVLSVASIVITLVP